MHLHQFSLFPKSKMTHASFFKEGGVSKGAYASLNMSYSSEDDPKNVAENRKRMCLHLKIPNLYTPGLCHGGRVAIAGEEKFVDGVITDKPGLGLLITHADCQAALFYDPVHHAIGAVHCGWRGNVLNIYKKTVEAMGKTYHSRPEDLLVAISPSLGPDAAEFINYKEEFPESFHPFQTKPNHFNLWEISRSQLMECGVKQIEIAEICTYENSDLCFSYRREKKSGRLGTIIALN
ncbi:MAG: Polyphenol oxidase [Chlamydiales bacterium]|nr:Polyphenol oxidase [Chlamydiales bacterium]MCH9619614.1 Polyphenol oxidase [Chlamydiales bacterium]MCH9623220.1 Polyphenol oxidase [Chlamydiales bacterium]